MGLVEDPVCLAACVAGVFSLAVGLFFLVGNEGVLPDLQGLLGFLGT